MNKRFLKADAIHLGNGEVLEDGYIVINSNGNIEEIGKELDIPSEKIEHFEGILCPGFINTHCHLELSHLKGKIKEHTKLHGFIQELQTVRESEEDIVNNAILATDKEMYEAGIVAVGDICNAPTTFNCKKDSKIYYHSFIELFAYDPEKAERVFKNGSNIKQQAKEAGISASIVPHAPYSVSDKLFGLISKLKENQPISIHNQETASENELFQKGSGGLAEMLIKFSNQKEEITAQQQNSLPAYLSKINKNSSLLLVHNTFTEKEDIEFAEQLHSKLFWCFCPNANLYIENRLPNIPMFIDAGVRITLGTDSLASNHKLSILEEMKSIQKAYPEIPTSTLIQWGTKNGADFLGLKDWGELKVGYNAGLLHISNIENGKLTKESSINRIT